MSYGTRPCYYKNCNVVPDRSRAIFAEYGSGFIKTGPLIWIASQQSLARLRRLRPSFSVRLPAIAQVTSGTILERSVQPRRLPTVSFWRDNSDSLLHTGTTSSLETPRAAYSQEQMVLQNAQDSICDPPPPSPAVGTATDLVQFFL